MSISYGGDYITDTDGGKLKPSSSVMRNRIINGAMVISQRNGTSTVTPADGDYTLDRWQAKAGASSKYSVAQSTTAPVGFTNSLLVTSLSAYTVGAAEAFSIRQAIEGFNTADLGWGTANAKTVTLSFQVRSSLTGIFGGSIFNVAADYSYPFTYTISSANTWTSISVTITGPTSGTWATNNTAGVYVVFGLGVGSTLSGTAGSWASATYISATGATSVVGTSGATFYITGVQLEVGSSATGFEYVNYQTSLANCQRYFYSVGGDGDYDYISNGWGKNVSTTRCVQFLNFPVTMRSIPTISSISLTSTYVGPSAVTSFTIDAASSKNIAMNVYTAGGLTSGGMDTWYTNATRVPRIQFSAEL